MHTHLSISERAPGGERAPNAAAVNDRGRLYGIDETKDDREIQRKVMRDSLLSQDERGRLENPAAATRIPASTRVSVVYIVYTSTRIPREGRVMSTQLIIRIEPQLKDKVARLARAEGKTTSEVVRELLEDYVASRDIAASIDGLWERIGRRLAREDVTSDGVTAAIREVRRGRA